MRHDAARALSADDDMPRGTAAIGSVASIDDAYADLRARASERRFERTPRPAPTVPAEEPEADRPRPTVTLPRTAPGRAYGAHRRGDDFQPVRHHAAGRQPG